MHLHRSHGNQRRTVEKLVGETHARINVKREPNAKTRIQVNCVVDTVADWTVLPRASLERLGIKPHRKDAFGLADGSSIEREIGRAFVEFRGRGEYTPVVFGEAGDSTLLGVVTLELLGHGVDPLRRELFPLDLHL